MPEAIDGVREFGCDGCIEVDVDVAKQVDRWRNLAREFLEHEMLVLRLGAELRRLEQAFAVPLGVADDMAGRQVGACEQPLAGKGRIALVQSGLNESLRLTDEPVVLGVENVVDRGEPDIFVHAPIASDVVRI
jgi:hypothetical protein